jgi:chromosome segregation ATPase
MADTKVKVNGNHANVNGNGNGTRTPEKTPVKHTKLWQLLALAKEVSKDVGSIEDYEKSAEERKALEQELEAKQGENKRLREFNDKVVREFSEHKTQASAKTEMIFAEFEQKYKTYESNKAAVEAMEAEVKEAREKLAATEAAQKSRDGEVEKLRQRLSSSETHAKNHAAKIREMNAECELHRSRMEASVEELATCKTKLTHAQSDLGEGILRDYGPEELKKL